METGNRSGYRLYNYIAVSFLYAAPPGLVVALIVKRKRQNLSTETSENQKATASPLYDEITTIATEIQLESNSTYGQVRKMSPLNE